MLAKIWRLLVAVFDWRTIWRRLTGQPITDVVFITNMRDEVDRQRYLGRGEHLELQHFDGPRYWLGNVSGRTRILNVTTDEMYNGKRKAAREYSLAAIRWAEKNGAKVVLLAAATKRLFRSKELEEIKAEFPSIIFTIGDNGTVLLLIKETLLALQSARLKPGYSRIAVLGPYGFLGEVMTRTLKDFGYEIIGAGPNSDQLERVREEFGIATCQTFSEIGKVDAVVACTHSKQINLTAESVELLRNSDKRLLVLDVAEPSNFRSKEYRKCQAVVIRQDAGNGYAPKLKYVLGAISYRMLRLTRGVVFGCFAEALLIGSSLKKRRNIKVAMADWLTVDEEKMELVEKMFEEDDFRAPSPRCFGKPVKSFDLEIKNKGQTVRVSAWKLTMQKMHIL